MNNELIITPLGTVSCYCKNNLNCPGFLIESNKNKLLLDCGNGISSLLKFPDDLKNLNIIISHLHSDHYGELPTIAQTSYVLKKLGYINDKIKVYIPEGDKIDVIEHYEDKDGCGMSRIIKKNIIDFDYLMSLNNSNTSYLEVIPYKEKDKLYFDNLEITFSKNPHPLITYSTKIENDELKLVYSSDTGYDGNYLENFAKEADLLICESTFLRGQMRTDNNHLYAYEAGLIARKANVKKLMLTHFWPEIEKEKYLQEAKEMFDNTITSEEGKKLILKRG